MIKSPFSGAIVKNVPMSGDGSFTGEQLNSSNLASGDDMGVPTLQFHEVAPPPKDVKEINPNVFGMSLGKSLKG